MSRLYRVAFSGETYVMADSAQGAESIASLEAVDDVRFKAAEAVEPPPQHWRKCFPWGSDVDHTVGRIWDAQQKESPFQDTATADLFAEEPAGR